MTEQQALDILRQVLADRRNWGEAAGIRVAQYELVNALLAVESRLLGDSVSKDELTLANRRYAALNAQHEKLKKAHEELQHRKGDK